jgi:hypothetical protein
MCLALNDILPLLYTLYFLFNTTFNDFLYIGASTIHLMNRLYHAFASLHIRSIDKYCFIIIDFTLLSSVECHIFFKICTNKKYLFSSSYGTIFIDGII